MLLSSFILLLLFLSSSFGADKSEEDEIPIVTKDESEVIVLHPHSDKDFDPVDDQETPDAGKFKAPDELIKFEEKDAIDSVSIPPIVPDVASELYDKAFTLLKAATPETNKEGWTTMNEAAESGDVRAKLSVAWARLSGTHFPLDPHEAHKTFEKLAAEGNADAQTGLGLLYATGTTVDSDQAKAILYYTFAAFGGSSWAQMALGYRYLYKVGVPYSCEKSLHNYRRVAEKVASEVTFSGGVALRRVRLSDDQDAESSSTSSSNSVLSQDLVDYYASMADRGDVTFQVGIGQIYYLGGRGLDPDHTLALKYFQQAANAGSSAAMAYLGRMYLDGVYPVTQDNDTAHNYFKQAAMFNNPIGLSGLGYLYLFGHGVTKDYDKALVYFSKAAEENYVDALLYLGVMHFYGYGVARDFKLANGYFIKASQSGNVLALYYLAEMHASGFGIIRSCETATEMYKNVAERGKWGRMMMDAYSDYKSGKYEEALMKYMILGELGMEVAQSNVAFILDKMEVKSFDDSENRALIYYVRSASQGYSNARVRVGDYYYYGLGVDKDFSVAAYHYRIASKQNNPQAMFNLGYMHESGMGMAKDFYLAKRYYDLSWETSPDAAVPAGLALFKLGFLFFLEFLNRHMENWIANKYVQNIKNNWDVYLLPILIGALGFVYLFKVRQRALLTRAQQEEQQQRQ